MKHVAEVAREPHPIGTAAHARAREYIFGELGRLGVAAEIQRTTAVSPARGDYLSAATVNNVVGVYKGTASTGAVLLVAHYDSVPTGPGAGDDGAGVAAVLEILRALKAGPPLRNDVVALFTDAEEVGLLGAWGFVGEHPLARQVGLVLNFEGRGSSGPSMMFETSSRNGRLIGEFGKAVSRPVASSLSYELYKLLPNDTDLSAFKAAGLAGYNFAFLDESGRYHTALDSADHLDERSLQHHGLYGLALARHFGNLEMNLPRVSDAVYFDILGLTLVRYSTAWVIPLGLLATALFAFTLWLGFGRKRLTLSGVGVGALLVLVSALLAALAVWGIWHVVGVLHPAYALFRHGDIYNGHYYALGFSGLAVSVTVGLFVVLRRRFGALNLFAGAAAWWWVLTAVSSVYLPGGSYLFFFPLVFTLTALIVCLAAEEGARVSAWNFAVLAACAVPVLVLGVPMVSLMFSALTVREAVPVTVFVVLLTGLLLPLVELIVRRRAWLLPAGLALASLGLLVGGSLASGFSKERPKPSSLFYAQDGDSGKAVWASIDPKPDEWTAQFIRPAHRSPLREFFPFSGRDYVQAQAQAAPLAAPVVELLGESTSDNLRTLHLRVKSPRQAPTVIFHLENAAITRGLVNGKPVELRANAAAEGRRRWGLRYYGLPAEGLELVLTVSSAEPLKVRVVDQSYGLPEMTKTDFSPRPSDLMPAPHPTSETLMLSKSYTF